MSGLLDIKNVNKQYPGVKALDNVTLEVAEGEVMALLGENGAGKSTLMKILSGAITRDSGEIEIAGKILPKHCTPMQSRMSGVTIIYQELSLLPQLSVAENIYLTHEPTTKFTWIDYKKLNLLAKEQLEKLRASHIEVSQKVDNLTLAEQQLVEIAKALAVDCKVLIMDEPTTSLTWEETIKLFDVIQVLKEQGVTIIYISHRLEEIFKIADSATVMRDGKIVGKVNISETDHDEIVSMMTGKLLERNSLHVRNSDISYTDENVVFEVSELTDKRFIKGASFKVYKNEVLGIAGLVGAKRTELARMIFGADKLKGGTIQINGKYVENKNPIKSIRNKIGYLSENRKEEGLNLGMTLRENIILTDMNSVSNFSFLDQKKIDSTFDYYQKSINIKGQAHFPVSSLSGGNQQKIVIAKWLHAGCDILFFDEPTRGIDVAAKSEIYKLIKKFAVDHLASIVISSDAAEIVDVCDRVLIVSKGDIVEEIKSDEVNQDNILKRIVKN